MQRRQLIRALAATPVAALLTSACGGASESPSAGRSGAATRPPADPAADAARIAAKLPDEDLVGQLLMPFVFGNDAETVTAGSRAANRKLAGVDTPAEMVRRYRLGGIILTRSSADDPTAGDQSTSNLESPQQIRRLTAGLQRVAAELAAKVPLALGTDQEHGVVTRIRDGVTLLPTAMAFGAADDAKLTERASRVSGLELAALGITVAFAPDADVIAAAGNAVIGSRSYGVDPALVSRHVAAATRGLQGAGVAAALKHFPGHGHTTTDSHHALPVLSQSRSDFTRQDLPPFAAGIEAGAAFVMSGHLDARAIDPGVPATLSRKVLVDLLRGELGFTGVVVTDSMRMAPVARYGPAESAVLAVLAGNDLLLMPTDVGATYEGLLAALKAGRLPRERLVDAATRVLTAKLRFAGTTPPAQSTVNSQDHQDVAAKAAVAGITVLRGSCGGALVRGTVRITGATKSKRDWLAGALRQRGAAVSDSGATVVHLVGFGDTTADLSADADVTVALDTPYLLGSARSPVLLATFGATRQSMTALADVLTGKAKPTGRCPVPVSGLPPTTCG